MNSRELKVKDIFRHDEIYSFVPYEHQLGKQYLVIEAEDRNKSCILEAGHTSDPNKIEAIPYCFKCLMSNYRKYEPDDIYHWIITNGENIVVEL